MLTIETEDYLVAVARGQRKRGLDSIDDGKLCPCGGWLIAHTLLVNDGGEVIVPDVYRADRRDKVLSEGHEAALLAAACGPKARAVILAIETGLSQEDFLVLL